MFIGRQTELEFLEEKFKSKKSEFVMLYGRRRIGKTLLLKTFVGDKKHVFYSAVQITDQVQLTKITNIVTKHFKTPIYSERFSDWMTLFEYISDHDSSEEKIVLVLDEFPYMVQGNSSIPSILQNHWDHYFSQMNIMIIICGSSMSFMEKEVLSEKNPLYGRTTGILKLKELDFNDARAFMGVGNLEEHLTYYSIFSGVPYYLSLINPDISFKENIMKNILMNGSVLFSETEFLLKQELREVQQYNAIIESIALGDTKLNEIYQKTGIEKTKLPYYLNSLISLGVVKKEYPVTMKVKERAKSRSGIYRIDNSYFRFYYAFVYPYTSELLDGAENIIFEDVIMKQLSMFVSYEFEQVAISHIRQLSNESKIPIRPIKLGRWWSKNQEIDLVGIDVNNRYIFGECKWRNEKLGMEILEKLKLKSMTLNVNLEDCVYMLYSKSGFTKPLIRYASEMPNIYLVDFSGVVPNLI